MQKRPSILNTPPSLQNGPQLLHELILWEKHSSRCAVDFTSGELRQRYSYRELESCTILLELQILKAIDRLNCGATQQIIPVLLPQSPGLYISYLAILASGSAFCPINIDIPKDRVKFITNDIAANLLISTSDFIDLITWENGPSVILIDKFILPPSEMVQSPRALFKVKPDDLAYVMYTSGSTGLPKGVGITHLAISQSLIAHEKHIPPFKRFLQFAAPSFDVSVFEIFFSLARASTLVGCDRSQLINDLPRMINELEVDAAELTPTVVGSMIERRSEVPKLELLLVVGEMLTSPIVKEFGESETKIGILYGVYGPTEATIHCTIHPRMKVNAIPNNIGVPLDTVSTLIISPTANAASSNTTKMQPLSIGEEGELLVAGPQLARGYFNQDQKNLAFFQFKGTRYYKTGDKAMQLEDGSIEILGRLTEDQVKIRGQRIELREIEEAIYRYPRIKAAIAIVIRNSLVVFAIANEGYIDPENVMKTCRKWLPKFMLPNEIKFRTYFPYLASGKVDKKKLEVEYLGMRKSKGTITKIYESEPGDLVGKIVYDTLGPFPKESRLLAVGLDSLNAIKIASNLRASGFSITTISVLKAENLDELVIICIDSMTENYLDSELLQHGNKKINENTQIYLNGSIDDFEHAFPCTPQQSAMLSESAKDERLYRNWAEIETTGIRIYEQFVHVVHALSKSNPILRTCFRQNQSLGRFIQLIRKEIPENCFECVECFNYEYERLKDNSLEFPIRFQILEGSSSLKVLIKIHHALYDAWSLELLLDDLDNLLDLKTLPCRQSFESVVDWYMKLEDFMLKDWSIKDYWKDHLSGFNTKQLPNFNLSKSSSHETKIFRRQTSISFSQVEKASRRLLTSSQSIFQAAFCLILSSYLGTSDICFGTVFSGRTMPINGIENIVGPCIATLPIRVDISTSESLHYLVKLLNLTNRKHLEHVMPLVDIKSASRAHPGETLFDTILIWQQTFHPCDYVRKNVSLVDSADTLEFKLVLNIIPHLENIELKAIYQHEFIPKSQVNLLLKQLERITDQILKSDDRPIKGLFSCLESSLLSIENKDPKIECRGDTLQSFVEKIAAEHPNRAAVNFAYSISEKESDIRVMSYLELNLLANKMANYLIEIGIVPNKLVCICLDKSLELYTTILATTKVGAAWLPIMPEIPPDRLEYILREDLIQIIITHSDFKFRFEDSRLIKVLFVDQINLTPFLETNPLSKVTPENLAYAIFTSGSTGQPKGVLITQKNILNNLEVLESLYSGSKDTRLLQFCSHTFDVSVADIFFTWKVGGCLCSGKMDLLFQNLENAINTMRITHLILTPTVATLVDPTCVPFVEILVVLGEMMTSKVLNSWVKRGLIIGYGPSETTNIVTLHKPESHNEQLGMIGHPLKTSSTFVLCPDNNFTPVPRGGEGELCFGGSQVFRGYIDKSHEDGKIIDHPDFGRIYRTGDLGRLMPDGSILFLGRNDDQVKIRGQRVELGEINNVIMSRNPEISNCTTIIVGGSCEADQRLVCFWTSGSFSSSKLKCLNPDKTIIIKLRHSLELALPTYMIPSALIPISFIPITTSGKVDSPRLINIFNGLSASYIDSTLQVVELAQDHHWSSLEKAIVLAVAQITKKNIKEIDADISFFSLGIDSISAIFLSKILQQNTGYQLSVSDILRFPSVARLATRVSSLSEEKEIFSLLKGSLGFGFDPEFCRSIVQEYEKCSYKVQIILPCTPLQEAILSAAESSSENIYCNRMIFEINGNILKLQKCWREMVQRHEILRTCFSRTELKNRAYVQVVLKEYNLQFKSITKLSETNSSFEINKPPYTLEFLHNAEIDKLVLSIHHALYDETAISILYEEIQALYYDQPLDPAISFAPLVEFLESTDFTSADIYWSKVLKNCLFPKFEPKIENQNSSSIFQTHSIKIKFYEEIKECCQKHETSLLSVLMTVWACVLAEKLQSADVCFGNVVNCRSTPITGIERLVAPCFNTIPSRITNIQDLSYIEAFRIFQKFYAESLDLQTTPLRRIQSKFCRNGSRLFDSLLVLQQPLKKLDSSIWNLVDERGFTDIPLVCNITPKIEDDILELTIQSQSCFFLEDEVIELMNSFDQKLFTALENPRRHLLSQALKLKIIAKKEISNVNMEITSGDISSFQALNQNEIEIYDIITDFSDIPREKISRHSSIFYLGLDSINIIQFTARLRKKGHNLLVSDVFEQPTIHQLSMFLAKNQEKPSRNTNCKLDAQSNLNANFCAIICSKYGIFHENVEAIRPCTPFQQGMVARTIQTNGKEYFNTMWLRFGKDVSISKLKSAWVSAVREHQIFRTGIACTEDIKYPFVMVTYRDIKLPWFEVGTKNPVELTINERLIHNLWSLDFLQDYESVKLKFTAHHALYDALSIKMFLVDVARSYQSLETISRPPIKLLYDAIILRSQDLIEEKISFWGRSENKIIVNRFPDLNPLRVLDSSSHLQELKLKSKASDLEKKCRENCVTMQAVTQAAWARLLAFYIGEKSTTFGITLSGRSAHEDAAKISFPSTVTLPARFDVSDNNSALLARSMSYNSEVYRHQFTPLNLIKKWSGCLNERIFDTFLTYRKISNSDDNAQLPWQVVQEDCYVEYSVSLEVLSLKDDTLKLSLCFRLDFIPIEQASIILDQYEAILVDLLWCPKNACDVAPQAITSILSVKAAQQPYLPGEASLLHEFVELGAHKHPERIAFEFVTSLNSKNFQSKCSTYEELNQDSNRVANLLLHSGSKPGDVVAICFEKCPEATIASIGILKAGCICVALDPNSPVDRLDFILRDANAKILLTSVEPEFEFTEKVDTIVINFNLRTVYGFSERPPNLSRIIKPEDTSYILYTSGTTGRPKGCLITHDNFVHFMRAFSKIFEGHWTDDSKYLQFASYHFDVSIMEQFWSWSVGIRVVSASRDLIFEDITSAIQTLGITHIDLTPSLARAISPEDVSSLFRGAFITGGEQLEQVIVDKWGKYLCLYNGYGPTEVTIGCTMNPRLPLDAKPSNIGPAYMNVGTYVLKPDTELPVFRGGVGELCVSGKLVGKGYLNKPDLTAKKFPTLKSFRERVFRTGDLVRALHDGSFIFIGRADSQVKLRGQRLELSEIKETIKKNVEDIDELVILVLRHRNQTSDRLVAFFVTPSSNPSGQILNMQFACKSWLPGYMVPSHFIPIQKIPLSSTNKIDLARLSAIYNQFGIEDLQKIGYVSQRETKWSSHQKEILLKISRALDVEISTITHNTNIFELGLDSISVIGFSHALQNAGLKKAKLSVIRKNPFIYSLVRALLSIDSSFDEGYNAYIDASQNMIAFSQKHMYTVCNELSVTHTDVECISPCTPLQDGMIYRFLENKHTLYFNKFLFRLNQNVDAQRLLDAWNRVVSCTEIMRIKFVATDDGFCQAVMKSKIVSWNTTNDYDDMDKIDALKSPYSLSISSDTMILQIFHGLYDNVSLQLLLGHVISEYNHVQEIDYGPSFISCLPYGPLAKVSGAENFWCSLFRNWMLTTLPVDLDSLNDWTMSHSSINIEGFENFRQKIGVAPQAIIEACWIAALCSKLSSDLTIGIVVSGRSMDLKDTDLVVGPLFNTIPLNIRVKPEMTLEDLILICQDLNMRLLDFQFTALKDIQKWIYKENRKSEIFQTIFNFLRQDSNNDSFSNNIWTEISTKNLILDYPLTLDAILDMENSQLSLSLYALTSFLGRDNSIELMKQLEDLITVTIKNSGKNKVPFSAVNKISSTFDPGITLNNEKADKDNKFMWTRDAEIIRNEISIIANIDQDSVDEDSSVFELGLDSIDVIKLFSRLKKLDVEIPVSDIIKSQTIEKMLFNVKKKKMSSVKDRNIFREICQNLKVYFEKSGDLARDIENILPATPLQQSMFNEMKNSGFKRYFTVDGFKISKDVDVKKLKDAIQTVVKISPILRTTFWEVCEPSIPVRYAQIIHKYSPRQVEFEDIILDKGETIEKYLYSFRESAASRVNLAQKLFYAIHVIEGGHSFLVVAISHALYDGASLMMIHEDINRAYNERISSRPDFIPYLEHIFESITQEAKNFWKGKFASISPSVCLKGEILGSEDSKETFLLERRSHIPLKKAEYLCRVANITLQTLGQTCWALVLAQLKKRLEVIFGTVLRCRDSDESSEVNFPLMNTVVLRSAIHGTLIEMLRYMQDMSNSIRQFQHFPLGMAQAYALSSIENQSCLCENTIIDTLFIYQGRQETTKKISLYELVHSISEVVFPISVEMRIVGDSHISWIIACKSNFRDLTQTKEILEALEKTLHRIVSAPDSPSIAIDKDGIQICGLPSIKIEILEPKSRLTHRLHLDNKEDNWSNEALSIRRALHRISGVPEESIHRDMTIYHLGLDSIQVLKLPASLKDSGIRLNMSSILRGQTVMDMAKSAQSLKKETFDFSNMEKILADAFSSPEVSRKVSQLEKEGYKVEYVMPATPGQYYMIRQWQISNGFNFYAEFEISIPSQVDQVSIKSAWGRLIKHNAIFRTGFIENEKKLYQVIFENPPNQIIDFSGVNSTTFLKARKDLRLPPINLVVVKLPDNRAQLKLVIHHALYDAISLRIFLHELQEILSSEDIKIEKSPHSFKNFVIQSFIQSQRIQVQNEWKSYLGSDFLYLPESDISLIQKVKKRIEVYKPLNPISDVIQKARDAGSSVDALFLAALAKLYAQRVHRRKSTSLYKDRSIIFGLYIANRAPFGEDLSHLMAPTLNILPLCIRKPLDKSLTRLALEIQSDIHKIAHSDMVSVTLSQIFEWTSVRVDFCVNILKSSINPTFENYHELAYDLKQISLLRGRLDQNPFESYSNCTEMDEMLPSLTQNVLDEAYLSPLEIELCHHDNAIDVDIFGPEHMISVVEAENLIQEFVESLTW